MTRIESFLASHFRFSVIAPDCPDGKVGPPLMTRYRLFTGTKFAIFAHRFHRSDLDEFHDHPWTFIAFLIGGGYWEHVPVRFPVSVGGETWTHEENVRIWRRRFSILWRPAEFQHYIEIEKPIWTLVLRFRQRREWGFIKDGKWIWWRKFEDLKSRSICEDVEAPR